MDHGMIGKIEKSKRYAEEPERIRFDSFSVTLRGDHIPHTLRFADQTWQCDCHFFHARQICAHVMTMERILKDMIPTARTASRPEYDNAMINKIEKSIRYAQEPERVYFDAFSVTVRGDNNDLHPVRFANRTWQCDCTFFRSRKICAHTMTMERVLRNMMPGPAEIG